MGRGQAPVCPPDPPATLATFRSRPALRLTHPPGSPILEAWRRIAHGPSYAHEVAGRGLAHAAHHAAEVREEGAPQERDVERRGHAGRVLVIRRELGEPGDHWPSFQTEFEEMS